MEDGDDKTFNHDEVQGVVSESVETVLGTATYSHSKVGLWQATIVENVLKKLAHFNRPFKYIVTCMVAQNTGSSTHTAHTYVSRDAGPHRPPCLYPHAARCFWDTETDGFAKHRFESSTIVCLTTVYGMGI